MDAGFDRLRGRAWADRVFYAASAVGDHGILWLVLAAVKAAVSPAARRGALRTAAGVGLESVLVNLGIKSLFRRVRPEPEQPRPMPLRQPRTSSFPSGHASSAFTAAALLAEGDPLRPVYYALAVIVSLSRIHVRIHHASDVVAGALVGMGLGRLGRRLVPLSGIRSAEPGLAATWLPPSRSTGTTAAPSPATPTSTS